MDEEKYFGGMDISNFNVWNKKFYTKIVEHDLVNPLKKCKKILDCGCGTGNKMLIFKQNGKEIEGFDLSKKAIEYVKKKGLNGFISSVYKIQTGPEKYDGVYSWCVLEHLDNPQKALAEMNRVLKPGGKIIVSTEIYSKDFFTKDETHVKYFTYKEITKLFEGNEFLNIKIKKSHYPFKGCIYLPHFLSVPISYLAGLFISSIIIIYAEKP